MLGKKEKNANKEAREIAHNNGFMDEEIYRRGLSSILYGILQRAGLKDINKCDADSTRADGPLSDLVRDYKKLQKSQKTAQNIQKNNRRKNAIVWSGTPGKPL